MEPTGHNVKLESGRKLDLSRWCVKQRIAYDQGRMRATRETLLNSVSFDWTGDLGKRNKKKHEPT